VQSGRIRTHYLLPLERSSRHPVCCCHLQLEWLCQKGALTDTLFTSMSQNSGPALLPPLWCQPQLGLGGWGRNVHLYRAQILTSIRGPTANPPPSHVTNMTSIIEIGGLKAKNQWKEGQNSTLLVSNPVLLH
jgi:hypothetical protein